MLQSYVDSTQLLKWMLGSVAVGKQYGAVSAVTFNRDTDRLLCGFARGQVSTLLLYRSCM